MAMQSGLDQPDAESNPPSTDRLCSPEIVRRHFHELKWSWKRPRVGSAQSTDLLAEQKLARLAEFKATLKSTAHLLYVDEADFHLLSPIRASWSLRGEPPVDATPGTNKRVYAFKAYDPASKQVSLTGPSSQTLCGAQWLLAALTGSGSRQTLPHDR